MSANTVPYSLAPTRIFIGEKQIAGGSSPSYEPPAPPVQSRMRVLVDGVEQPYIEPVPAEEPDIDPGVAQKQADEEAYRRLLERSASRSRTDYAGQAEDRRLNEKMLRIRRLRNEHGRDYISPIELEPPRRDLPPRHRIDLTDKGKRQ